MGTVIANRAVVFVSVAAALLSGCALPSSSSKGPDDTPLPAGAPGAMPQQHADRASAKSVVEYAYVVNLNSNNVTAYRIDASSGALMQVKGSPFGAGIDPYAVAVDPTARFVYVINLYSNDVSAYAIDARSGALTPLTGSPFGPDNWPYGIATCRVKGDKCIPSPV